MDLSIGEWFVVATATLFGATVLILDWKRRR